MRQRGWSLTRRAWMGAANAEADQKANDLVWELRAEDGRCPKCGEDVGSPYPRSGRDRCTCTRETYESTKADYLAEHRAEMVAVEWEKSGVPPRHRNARLDTFRSRPGAEVALARCQQYAESFEAKETTGGLYLAGPFGSGKTHLAVAVAHQILARTLTLPRFISAGGLISSVKGGDSVDMSPVKRAIGAELLILDDVGQVGRTAFDREIMYEVVSERYDHTRPTIITSNLPADRLAELLGGAFSSRLYEATEILIVTATDYRKENAKRATGKGAA